MTKLNLFINKQTDQTVSDLAQKVGTSKKNIMALAFIDILKNDEITEEKMEIIKGNIHLNYRTSMTVKEPFNEKINRLNTFGIPKSRFFGYLICDFFYRKRDMLDSGSELATGERDYSAVFLSEDDKKKIINFTTSYSISIGALFSFYILNKKIEAFVITKGKSPSMMKVYMKESVKERLVNKADEKNVSVDFYLRQVAEQIKNDYQL